jgi:AAA15 family ATPase/GTPase
MLVEFCVGNYRSFRDPVTLSMVAANLRSQDKDLDENNVFDAGRNLRLLTSAAIYGANASGKSNLVRALGVMRNLVLRSTEGTQSIGGISVERFRLSTETIGKPSHFQIVFLVDGTRYRYGFEATDEQVVAEWLYYVPTTREARLFERQQDQFTFGDGFREGRELADKTRPNALLLSVAAQFNSAIARKIVDWFHTKMRLASGLSDTSMRVSTIVALQRPELRSQITELVLKLDLGISDLRIERIPLEASQLPPLPPGAPKQVQAAMEALQKAVQELSQVREGDNQNLVFIKTIHSALDAEGKLATAEVFDLEEHESEGTKKLFSLAGPLIQALRTGQVLIMDELDARLHPLITQAIIGLFNSIASNPKHAQLIFATQDANLLDRRYFRRDQVWFTEKDRQGATQFYSLAEFKVRNDASFGRDYIRGKYGAVPYIGDLTRIASDEV